MTLHEPLTWKALASACDAIAVAVTWSAALSVIQGLFGAIGAVLSVVYLYYRIKKARRDAK